MLKNMNIGTLLSLGFSSVLILIIAITIPVINSTMSSIVKDAEQRELKGLYETAIAELESEARLAEALSTFVANQDIMSELFANNQRQQLADHLVPTFQVMKKDFNARQFQYHTPPATSFLRLHKPAKFGDDLSSFRNTVVATNAQKQRVHGLEKGVAGLGIRGISPVFHNNRHIGSVEFGMSFGQPFFDLFKSKFNVDISLYSEFSDGFRAIGSTRSGKPLFQADEMRTILNGIQLIKQQLVNNQELAVFGHRINDFSGNPVGVLEFAMDRSGYATAIRNARYTTLIIGGISLVLGWLFSRLVSSLIGRPLRQTVEAMDEIAQGEGDLTRRLDESGKNEISKLAAAFNRFAEKVRIMVSKVSGSTTQLASAAEEMSMVTEETSRGVQKQQSETDQVATAMNQMTATVQEVARHATQAAEAAASADQDSSEGRNIVINTMKSIENLAHEISSASTVISQLEQDSENIGSVLDVIRGIAEQTNLLALNAAIEAARAGEQGRGFAVVADEVRTLASKTQQSTSEIQEMIEKLQLGARSAVQAMQESSQHAAETVNQSSMAAASLEKITAAVSMIKDMNTQIAIAAEQQSSVSEEINKNVVNISMVVNDTAEGASQTSAASGELARLSMELQKLVGQFKV